MFFNNNKIENNNNTIEITANLNQESNNNNINSRNYPRGRPTVLRGREMYHYVSTNSENHNHSNKSPITKSQQTTYNTTHNHTTRPNTMKFKNLHEDLGPKGGGM